MSKRSQGSRSPNSYPDHWPPVLLHHHFLQYARLRPSSCAIDSVNGCWSYKGLYYHSFRFASTLSAWGLSPGDRVILELDPCPEAVALIAACSMLGLVFVPVGPDTPPARIDNITSITEAALHIHSTHGYRPVTPREGMIRAVLAGSTLELEDESQAIRHLGVRSILESDLCYIIFTSGTTGKPKGIMMSHRAVLAFFRGLVDHCGLGPSARVGTFAPLQFDFSLLDMGLAFGSGATLVQVPRILFHNPKQLLGYLNETRVTQMNSVPALWRAILRHAGENLTQLRHLEAILFAGEPFPIADLIRLRASLPSLRVINCFGQSESIACSFTDVPIPLPPETENLSIGFAHPGAEMLLIDPQGQEIRDPGIVGEIYLRGATLFLGYWRDPNATAEALVLNPLRPLSGERVFRTGDMAYKGPIGDLYFCGRRDQQVKILGNRVELAEVESRLCAHSGVDQAVAVATRYQDDTKLIAYVVRKKDGPAVTRDELHLFCKSNLNSYMIPTLIKFVDTLPINSNGKLDRASLFTDKLI